MRTLVYSGIVRPDSWVMEVRHRAYGSPTPRVWKSDTAAGEPVTAAGEPVTAREGTVTAREETVTAREEPHM